jgi:hypothetical protein
MSCCSVVGQQQNNNKPRQQQNNNKLQSEQDIVPKPGHFPSFMPIYGFELGSNAQNRRFQRRWKLILRGSFGVCKFSHNTKLRFGRPSGRL